MEHVLLLTIHHIAFDEGSFGVLLHELATLYRHSVEPGAQVPALPALPIQYADFAVWEQGHLQGQVLTALLDYWKGHLAGAPAVLDLPTDRPRPPLQTFNGGKHSFTLPATHMAQLQALGRREGATIFMILLAALKVLLGRYSGQDHIIVGVPFNSRMRTELENLIGLFFNTLPLHTDLSGNPTFRALLGRVREHVLEAHAHRELPFEKLIESLKLKRTLSHTALYQVLFDYHLPGSQHATFPDLTFQHWETDTVIAKFDLNLVIDETEHGLAGVFVYNADLFEARTIARMAEHFQILLDAIVAAPDQPIASLRLISPAEYAELIVERNATQAAYPTDRCYHQFVEAQARRTPDAIAVRLGDQYLTYAALDRRANQLAHALRELGAGPEVRVAICLERSLEIVIGLLGILKAGAAFVPLDPSFPPERMGFILSDAQAIVLITQQSIYDVRFAMHDRGEVAAVITDRTFKIVNLDRDWPTISRMPSTPPASGVTADNLMYLIYTSGSTGRPKGVLIPHRGLVNYLVWCLEPYTVAAGHGGPVHASIAADAIFPSLFAPLMVGTTVTILPEKRPLDALADMLCTQGDFSLIKITPSQLEVLTHHLPPIDARGWVRTLVVGAEEVRGEVLAWWRKHAPDTIMLNEYGPTETVVGCSIYQVPPDRFQVGTVPLGLPIANIQFYVLDSDLQPVPIGVAGELYIGGDGVAWGYHNRPDLTAERFIPNPFAPTDDRRPTTDSRDTVTRRQGDKVMESSEAITPSPLHPFTLSGQSESGGQSSVVGGRLYKTGDLVRVLDDRAGNVVFLGRIDDQIKIRGYRVELGEVATVILEHPGVGEAVVLAREDVMGEKRLIAYIVPTTEDGRWKSEDGRPEAAETPSSILHPPSSILTELRAFLAARLPDYMIPAAFVMLEALPLAPHGKLDRQALPVPNLGSSEHMDIVAPRTPLERQLVDIWESVMNTSPIGVTDSFFELGGHSLLAVRLLKRIEDVLGKHLPLATLFQNPTIADQARALGEQSDSAPQSPLVAIQPAGSQLPLFCIHPVGGNVVGYFPLAHYLGQDQPIYGLQAPELAETEGDHSSIEEMATQYIAAIRAIQPAGPYALLGWSFGGIVAFEMAQQLYGSGQRVGLLGLIDSHPPDNLGSDAITDAAILAQIAIEHALQNGASLPIDIVKLQQLEPTEQLSYVVEQIKLVGLDFNTDSNWLRGFLRGFRIRTQALARYRPQHYPGQITLFKKTGEDAEVLRIQALVKRPQEFDSPTNGWERFSAQPIIVRRVPGYHSTVLTEPNIRLFAEQLRESLRNAT